jgi:hypothetical protein
MGTDRICTASRTTARGLLLILLAFALNGCVSLSDYDRDMARLQKQIRDERASHEAYVRTLELKLKDRAKVLDELTARYGALQQEKLSQGNLRFSKDDLDVILKKIKELKVEVRDNVSGPKGVEMTETLKEMERKVNILMGNPVYND